ncbi:hypothetical protein [Bifidobacterium catulorum]|uniref:Uncharacterized protein n=1 Tax=Bifidobacterium catulorum TaxID=1630173 RepID=A0A2U2MS89_9BIFI|nr:hypothetical protein [Bifidobacterium catulorum]PWG59728.1 hypothetical protein DF200_06220 [Bifidobacterium catulorum]
MRPQNPTPEPPAALRAGSMVRDDPPRAAPSRPFSTAAIVSLAFAVVCCLLLCAAAVAYWYLGRGEYRAEDALVLLAAVGMGMLALPCAAVAFVAGAVGMVQCLRPDARTGRTCRGMWMAVVSMLVALPPLAYAIWAQLNAM